VCFCGFHGNAIYYKHDRVKNWALIISCYVLTLLFIHTISTCIVRLGDICNALRYSNQYFFISFFKGRTRPLKKLMKNKNCIHRHSLHDSSQCLLYQTIFAKFMKMSISCLLKSIVSIKYFESDFLEKS
jgi:hypothetical protein